jgi:large subunit ribosomal protein L27
VRQCGNKFWAGENVGQGRDFTLFAKVDGRVQYSESRNRRYITVDPTVAPE